MDPGEIIRGVVVGVAEPDDGKRKRFSENYIFCPDGEKLEFGCWREMVTEEGKQRVAKVGVDGILVCTLDYTHEEIILSLRSHFPTTHLFSEKPLTASLPSLLRIYTSLGSTPPIIFSIGHVLRYSSLLLSLKKLLCEDQVIGDIIHLDWTEPVGYWHFAHSYVRGNWAETGTSAPSLLTKCCHDVDILMWLLCSPHYRACSVDDVEGELVPKPTHAGVPGMGVRRNPHLPTKITSTGTLVHFRKKNKPVQAGDSTNCFGCSAELECIYSAKKIYLRDNGLSTGWPNKIVSPDIEGFTIPPDYEKVKSLLTNALQQDYTTAETKAPGRSYYGRCVYESSNDVVDNQIVTLTWEDIPPPTDEEPNSPGYSSKTATLTMAGHTQAICERRGRVYGSKGEVVFSAETNSITVHDFTSGGSRVINPQVAVGSGHGGGDFGLVNAFVGAVRAVKSLGWDVKRAQKEWIGMDVEECVRSHAVVWAAEEARVGEKIVKWGEWWDSVIKKA